MLAHNFEIKQEISYQTATSHALKNGHFWILHKLLISNSKFPTNFNIENVSQEIIEFVNESKSLHEHVANGNEAELLLILERNRVKKIPLKYFYNTENISASFLALQMKKYKIYKILTNNKITVGPNEDFSLTLSDIPEDFKRGLFKLHEDNAKDLPRYYLNILKGKSKIAADNEVNEDYKMLIDEAYNTLNCLETDTHILEIAATSSNLEITFDFNRESTIFLDPNSSNFTSGLFFPSGKILIAAKNLLREDTKHEVYGVILHELCHLTMALVFRNKCKPYSISDKSGKSAYENLLNLCEKKKGLTEIIDVVYNMDVYEKEYREAELIVRVPQLYACNFNNPEGLRAARFHYNELFSFFEGEIIPILKKSLAVLRKLGDPKKTVHYEDLTDELKKTLKNKKILFQGVKIKLNSILPQNSAVYSQLTSDEIKSFFHGKTPEIGHKLDDVDSYIQRRFLLQTPNVQAFSFNELLENSSEYLKILVEKPGEGKSTFFVKAAYDLKQKYPHKLVLLIDIKSFEHLKLQGNWSLDEIKNFLVQDILKISEFGLKIFNALFEAGNVVILWDSLCDSTKTALKIIRTVEISSSVQQWVACDAEHENILKDHFTQNSFKFIALTDNEKTTLLEIFMLKKNLNDNCVKNTLMELFK